MDWVWGEKVCVLPRLFLALPHSPVFPCGTNASCAVCVRVRVCVCVCVCVCLCMCVCVCV